MFWCVVYPNGVSVQKTKIIPCMRSCLARKGQWCMLVLLRHRAPQGISHVATRARSSGIHRSKGIALSCLGAWFRVWDGMEHAQDEERLWPNFIWMGMAECTKMGTAWSGCPQSLVLKSSVRLFPEELDHRLKQHSFFLSQALNLL